MITLGTTKKCDRFLLFGYTSSRLNKSRLYSCQVIYDGELIRNMIPCKNDFGVIGLYDLANNKFYSNAGSGEFVAGERKGSNVMQIADKNNQVMWKHKPSKARITIVENSIHNNIKRCEIIIDGISYNYATTISVPIGTSVTCIARGGEGDAEIIHNGTTQASSEAGDDISEDIYYTFIIESGYNITIRLSSNKATGRIDINSLWKTEPVVLDVEKIVSDTYASETTYENEEFILLDIYPQAVNSVVKVTYGNLTKTLRFDGGNSQKVYFGTFNGVPDEVDTPSSGILIIEGDYDTFATGSFMREKLDIMHTCGCITAVVNWGSVTKLSNLMLANCTSLTSLKIPNNITSIGGYAFRNCTNLTSIVIPDSVTSIGLCAFWNCSSLTSVTIPDSVTTIGNNAFQYCTSLTSVVIPDSVTTIGSGAFRECILLTNIVVGSDNAYYCSDGRTLFNKNKTVLHSCPAASGHYVIPDGVVEIYSYAFYGTNIEILSIPNSTTSIGNYILGNCTSLITVLFANTSGWYVTQTKGATSGTSVATIDAYVNATNFTSTYQSYYWYRA
jgi:hypothetical protein